MELPWGFYYPRIKLQVDTENNGQQAHRPPILTTVRRPLLLPLLKSKEGEEETVS